MFLDSGTDDAYGAYHDKDHEDARFSRIQAHLTNQECARQRPLTRPVALTARTLSMDSLTAQISR